MTPLYLSRRKFTALSLSGGFSALARPRGVFAAEMTEQEMLEALRSHKPQCGGPAPSFFSVRTMNSACCGSRSPTPLGRRPGDSGR